MVQINFAQKTVNVKVVFYGPGMSGKTTNLEVVHQRAPETNRGELTSISTDGDRTLFFDYMPLDLGMVAGMRTCFQLYTVPGQVYYNSTRKLVLQGVDGIIFVADSSASMLEQNLESLRNLEENLNEYGKSLATLPHVLQWNKRDLPDAMPVSELERLLNHHKAPTFEAIASTGQGVFPTLKALAGNVLKNIMQESGGARLAGPSPAVSAASAAAPRSLNLRESAAPAPLPVSPHRAPAHGPAVAGAAAARVAPQPQAPPVQAAAAAEARAPSPSELMQPRAKAAAAPARPTRASGPRARNAVPARRAKAQTQSSAARSPAPAAARKKSAVGVFVIVAAVMGAAIAWAALTFLA